MERLKGGVGLLKYNAACHMHVCILGERVRKGQWLNTIGLALVGLKTMWFVYQERIVFDCEALKCGDSFR